MLDVAIRAKSFRSADGTVIEAVGDLRLSVPTGRFTCLVGPSGCGKTTILRLILGLDRHFDGEIAISETGAVAAVFQEPRLLPWRTVEENIRLALPGASAGEDLSGLFQTLGLAGLETFYPGELSLGLARRAALARAFALRPSLLLLDEPFVSLDEALAARLRGLLAEVWSARPTTVLMVTHNLREAVELADEIVLLTPRPARVSGVYPVTVPRSRRDAATVTALLADLTAAHPGTA
ncbi:NitT/TauT family transport system ATP-binding protein [Hoeflea marina]|uniref:NitT/TauT family transport system ATP-binding protein n=1 Tax=Hoeflea marina TaxID=274592 RepID=A0A317PS38_9HYPH|nr:ATP-binding cassette domain-containing protein [Hoeflea marina]PWW01704.1 NitT/TauT family transport system ATP-binding protein [Hoeflea marina]